MYATGGEHAVRRWHRNLAIYCPQKLAEGSFWLADLARLDPSTLSTGWEYALLNLWVSRREITQEQAAKIVQSSVVEILFEIAQAGEVTDQIKQDSLSTKLRLMKLEEATAKAQTRWQQWQSAKLTAHSPNQAPVIRQPEQLQKHVSAAFYQNLVMLLNGQNTLQDLAVKMRRDLVEVGTSLLPFIQLGWVELIETPDLPAPVNQRSLPPSKPAHSEKLIACVDDSFLVRHTMEKLLTSAGYQFIGVDDALRAIGILLARKPDLIFLDLMMPKANGHEVCEQLRKLSCFRNTPIVILTGSDGFANRLRSNFVGASDFLSKPLDAEAVLSVIHKHLEPQSAANFSLATEPN